MLMHVCRCMIKLSTHFQQIPGGTCLETGTKLIFVHKGIFDALGKYQFCTCPWATYNLFDTSISMGYSNSLFHTHLTYQR